MAPSFSRRRKTLQNSIEEDVYTVLKELENTNEGGAPFRSIEQAYDAILQSNSRLRFDLQRRTKALRDGVIDRALSARKKETADSSDSEAAIEAAEAAEEVASASGGQLLNRQMVKLWHPESKAKPKAPSEPPVFKRRRTEDDIDDSASRRPSRLNGDVEDANNTDSRASTTRTTEMAPSQKKMPKGGRFTAETICETRPLAGFGDTYNQIGIDLWTLLKCPTYHDDNGLYKHSGILVLGPAGMGKKSLVREVASLIKVPIVSLRPVFRDPDRMAKGMTEAFDVAMSSAPCIVFVGDIDKHMSTYGSSQHKDHHALAVDLFMEQMERLSSVRAEGKPVLAVATASRAADLCPNLLKADCFGKTHQLKIPDQQARHDILGKITQSLTLGQDVDLSEIAKLTHGYVPGDLVSMTALASSIAASRLGEGDDTEVRDSELRAALDTKNKELLGTERHSIKPDVPVSMENFKTVIKDFTPSLRKEGFSVIPDVTWDQVGALAVAREQLDRNIIGPIKQPELYQKYGLAPNAGVLLWGPPGCGKTLVAQAVANDAQASFILINGPELLNKYVGETERAVRELFDRARSSKPCIVFFDEIDSIVPPRAKSSTESSARVVNALLTELDGARGRSGVYVIGTTNRPDMIDEAILRPGRLGSQIFIDLPTPQERVEILHAIYKTQLGQLSAGEKDLLARIALHERCTNFSGADLSGLHINAAQIAIKRYSSSRGGGSVGNISEDDWLAALGEMQPSVKDPDSYRQRSL